MVKKKKSPALKLIGIVVLVLIVLLVLISIVSGAFKFKINISKNVTGMAEKIGAAATYQNPDLELTMKVPASFTEKQDFAPGLVTAFVTKKQSSSDNFIENVILGVTYLGQKQLSVSQAAESWITQSKQDLDGMQVDSQENIELDAASAQKINYSVSDTQGDLKGETIVILKDQKVITLVYSAAARDDDKYHDDFVSMYESIKFGTVELEWETYKSDYGFSVQYPKNWVVTDNSDDAKREVKIAHPQNFANVVIAGRKDSTLKNKETMQTAIDNRKAFLESEANISITKYDDQVEENKGGWMINAVKTNDSDTWQLHERGLLDIYGKVLLMQAGYSQIYGKQYQAALVKIMDSFKVE